METEKFWMVYVEGENAPAYKHNTYESAVKEAERLTELTHKPAYILVADMLIKERDKFERISMEECPF